MTAKTFKTLVAVSLVVVLIFACGISASAAFVDDLHSNLEGALTGLHLYSLVTREGNIYTYTYTLSYAMGVSAICHEFGVGNPEDLSFFGSTNDKGFTSLPFAGGNYVVTWTAGTLRPGETATFSYQSTWGPCPQEIPVFAYAVNEGGSSSGDALGMAMTIPEPGALAGLAVPLTGLAFTLFRKRR